MLDVLKEQLCQKITGLTYAQAQSVLKRDLPAETQVTIDFRYDGDVDFEVKLLGVFLFQETYRPSQNFTYDSEMRVQSALRGKGYGRILMRNNAIFAKLCGLTQISADAGSDWGGYVWARFGFLPDFKESGVIDSLRRRLANRFEDVAPYLEKAERENAGRLIKMKDPKDLWCIADLRLELNTTLRQAFFRANITGGLLPSENNSFSLGRYFLAGSFWHGYLNLNDAEQMARAEKYSPGIITPNPPLSARRKKDFS